MRRLRLVRTVDQLPAVLEQAAKREISYSDFLEELLGREIAGKQERNTTMRISMAHFPFDKSLDSFDFKFQPSIDPKLIRELATCRFITNAENVLLLGPPGVGKTHLAVALGVKACAAGYRTLFTTAAALITTLTRAQSENRLEEKLKALTQPKLLILDEIGYLPLRRLGSELAVPTHRPTLRARIDCADLEPESDRLGRSVRRCGHRHGRPRSAAAPLHNRERERRELPTEGEAQGWVVRSFIGKSCRRGVDRVSE